MNTTLIESVNYFMDEFKVGDLLTAKEEFIDDFVIYKISEARRSNTEFQVIITNEGYWNYGERWMNRKQLLKQYRPLNEVEKLLYV